MTECSQLKSQRQSFNPLPELIFPFNSDALSALATVAWGPFPWTK
jgi:hypothetical protein